MFLSLSLVILPFVISKIFRLLGRSHPRFLTYIYIWLAGYVLITPFITSFIEGIIRDAEENGVVVEGIELRLVKTFPIVIWTGLFLSIIQGFRGFIKEFNNKPESHFSNSSPSTIDLRESETYKSY